MSFEEWFNQINGYSLLCEQFYSDLDYYTQKTKELYSDENEYKNLQRNIVGWLQVAYNEGFKEGQKEKK